MKLTFKRKLLIGALLFAFLWYTFFLIPHYRSCIESGTDKGVCIHTWLFRW